MDDELRQSMFRYYDERAPEYEDVYLLGTGSASIPDPAVFQTEAAQLGGVVERFGHGRLIDIACGTGFWLPRYATRCSEITLLDQSEGMLAETRRKAERLGVRDRCAFVRADVFGQPFTRGSFDSALLGFLVSHITGEEEQRLFATLETMLGQGGEFLILDSAWSAARARFNAKVERQERRLNDGTPFEIYKRYFDEQDVHGWEAKYGVTVSIEHFGTAFVAASGRFHGH